MRKGRLLKLLLGPLMFLVLFLFLPKEVFPTAAERGAIGTIVWMAFWWITGPIEFAVTAFLPIAINALLQMADMSSVIANYASETILLLLGASILTVSWEKTGLDQRMAAKLLSLVDVGFRQQIIFWFILAAMLSAVLPNAVVCATITPIAVSMLHYIGEDDIAHSRVGSLLLLTIVYATGVGGLATPLGGAMNLVTVDYIQQITGEEYLYLSWVIRFFPVMVVLVASNVLYMLKGTEKGEILGGSKEYFRMQYRAMDKMQTDEKLCLALFVIAAVLSFSRQIYQSILPNLKPAYVFIICAVLSFLIEDENGQRLMVWKDVQKKIIWDLLYVFAGGLAAGTLINESGAAAAIGTTVARANLTGGFLTVFVIVTMTVILSDVTSNTATAAVAIPIVISIIEGIGENPIPYIYIASIGVNLSYMLPTSIRAIPVGYGLQPQYMLKKGIPLTVLVIVLMSIMGYLMLRFWPMFSTV